MQIYFLCIRGRSILSAKHTVPSPTPKSNFNKQTGL